MVASTSLPVSQASFAFEDDSARELFARLFTRGKNADFRLGARLLRYAQESACGQPVAVRHIEDAYERIPACLLGCRVNCGVCD